MKVEESKTVCIRLPVELAEWLKKQAQSNVRPISYEVRKLLEEKRNALQEA